MTKRRFWPVGQVVGCMALCGLLVGCGGTDRPQTPLPKLQPVRGQLLRAGQPVSGGSIHLEPIAAEASAPPDDPSMKNLSIRGTVGPDGRFELFTLQTLSMQSGPGAPVGQYQATYHPPSADQTVQYVEPITLAESITIREGQNDLKLSLDRPPAGKR